MAMSFKDFQGYAYRFQHGYAVRL